MAEPPLQLAIEAVPAGRWGVAVSGGADSVALLCLLRQRADVQPHIIHLDHQTRGIHSTEDAAFVGQLAKSWSLPCTIATREQIEPTLSSRPANSSALYRALRWALFRQVASGQTLDGVILAHHADDQAETVFQRLLRSSSPAGVRGMSADAVIGGVRILRPLLRVRGQLLRDLLKHLNQPWREDASNQSPAYQRNRVRKLLRQRPAVADAMASLHEGLAGLRSWMDQAAGRLDDRFELAAIRGLPRALAEHALRSWLRRQGVRGEDISPQLVDRLLEMVMDAASPARQQLPGGRVIRRTGGRVSMEPDTGRPRESCNNPPDNA